MLCSIVGTPEYFIIIKLKTWSRKIKRII